ncbi:MBL fold metallo-hydrolase [Svornostia abyssi]|uniref:MBL fold metallo-hydrolase n=1 Tax=Svornostia abyssi TaxID=2898438 RepID=A0ABY5PF67_9ACTN|nr:MBL fold metallo-hydrolase [Parviterribacteraceae bacterium J379]
MNLTWLGWAGVELESGGATVVVDPLDDPAAVFAPLGDHAAGTPLPEVVAPRAGTAVAGLVTHLHRDHADARALATALAPTAPVLEPPAGGGEGLEELALAQAEYELTAAGFDRTRVTPWESVAAGPFTLTALPAADGVGDPQVAWLVEAGGVRVLHLGDTMFHGYWWRMALRHGPFDVVLVPVNGAVLGFPHRTPASPLPAALDPEQGAVAAEILGARLAIPIHAEGYEIDGVYQPVPDAAERFAAAAAERGVRARVLDVGESIEVSG